MAVPTLTVRIDWANDGAFSDALDACTGRVLDCDWKRGRSADFSGEATGAANLLLDNFDDRFTPDRNWHDNPSFEAGTTGWSTAAIASLTAAATSISQVTDNAPSAGTKAGEAVLTATLNSGATYAIPYKFRSGVTYAVSVFLKSTSGALTVRAGLASSGTPADIASSAANITTSWAAYVFTWTPSGNRADAVFFVRTTAAAAATLRIDAVQVNPGATANAYIEAPTKGQLIPGRPVHIYASYSGVDYPQFYGYVQRLAPNPADRTVGVTCYDVLSLMGETTVVVPWVGVFRSAREARREILEEFARGTRNLCANPSFETNTTGWSTTGASLARITTDAAPAVGGNACGQITLSNAGPGEGANFTCRMTPRYHTGETYRVAFYAKWVSGGTDYVIGLYGNQGATKPINLTSTWTRYTIAFALTQPSYAGLAGLRFVLLSATQHAGVALIDGAMVTRGPALFPYADAGTGRWANHCFNGDFEGWSVSGWVNPWTNLIANPSFETDTIGWSIAGDAFVGPGTSITRASTAPLFGSWEGTLEAPSLYAGGFFYALTGTFLAGVAYRASIWHNKPSGSSTVTFGIGSNGTPADFTNQQSTSDVTWRRASVTWTPTADRTDAHFYFGHFSSGTDTFYLDGAMVTRTDALTDYADTGPLGGGTPPTSAGSSAAAPYIGNVHLSIVCGAVANSGSIYDLYSSKTGFTAGVQISVSMYVRVAAGTAPLKVGISVADLVAGGFDEASATLTATTTYQRVALTWTPTAERRVNAALRGCLSVLCTDACGPTIYLDGVRVTPGATPEDLELPEWALAYGAEGTDLFERTDFNFSGTALSSLGRINAVTLTRHWVEATMTAPYWRYVTNDRASLAAASSAETFDDDFVDMTAAEIDRAAVVNIVTVNWNLGTETYGDASAGSYGPREGTTIDLSGLTSYRTIADVVGPALVSRYADPRARPTITVVNRFPSQLQRRLDDMVTVNFARLGIRGGKYLILGIEPKVTKSGQHWETKFQLEEYPY